MKLAEFSTKNSVLVNLLSVFIILAGVYAMLQMRREAFPAVDYDIVTVTTAWPGAPAEDVEKFVTIPLEEEIKSVSGLDEVNSKSDEGLSEIGVYINPGVLDKRKVVNDIQRAVDRVQNLPEGVEDDPLVFELATREFPVIEISLSGGDSETARRHYAESLKDELLNLKGVSQIREIGWRDKEFWVEADPEKMAANHVSLQDIMAALRSRNVTLPAGELTAGDTEFNIRTTGEFRTADEIAGVIIRANDAGNWLRVRDVASVKDTFEEPVNIARTNGATATAMVVVKTEQADAINLVADVRETLDGFRAALPENMEITETNDFSYYVKRRLGVLQVNGIIGFFLVLFILFVFLDPVPAFMTALGIPIALFLSFIVMSVMGVTINLVSMLGLILVLGMLVDDGIIVSENVFRYVEGGMPPRQAVIRGTNEVVAPVTVTILTTFAAFAPLLFMSDIMGKFIREIPFVVIITLSASLFEAFIILPAHLADFIGVFRAQMHKDLEDKRWFSKFKQFYTRSLNVALNRRYWVLGGMVLLFVFSIWVARTQMRFLLFAGEGIEYVWIRAEAPKGTPLERTAQMLKPVEDLIAQLPKEELDSYRTFVGSIETERGFDPNARRGSHLAQITVFLTPLQQRDRTAQQVAESLDEQLKQIPGFDRLYAQVPKEGPPRGSDVEVAIKGEDYRVMQEMAGEYVAYLNTLGGVSDIQSSYNYGKKQLMVEVNEEAAKKYGLSVGQVAETIRDAFKGGVATAIKPQKAEEEINVLVRFPPELTEDRAVFDKILVPNGRGQLIKLSSVANITEKEGIYVINHLDGKRVVYVTAQVDQKETTSLDVNMDLQKKFKDLENKHLGYTIKYGGEFEDQMKSFKNLAVSYLFALFLIFILLVAMFRSLIQPFIVMTAIPFGVIGVILSFWVHDMMIRGVDPSSVGRPLNFFALMGLVGLTGIVVNDSIVLVDFINRDRKAGRERRASLVDAGQTRLRPVIMTSVTTIGGLVSVAYGIGGGDPFLKPMALAIIWGLLFATALTLIGIPCIYAIFDDFTTKVLGRTMVKENVETPPY